MQISTSIQFILLFMFALALNLWSLNTLLLLMLVLVILLRYQHNNHYYRLMRRLKWFYLVMFIIFVFNTPGEHLIHWSLNMNPTYEGLSMGLIQVLRVALVLGIVSIILTQNTKQQLISGLYLLLKPLSLIGLDIERFSARLWLTLYYVELHQVNAEVAPIPSNLTESLDRIFTEDENDDILIELENQEITWMGAGAILGVMFVLLIAFLKVG